MIDIHVHLLPGVDDGPDDLDTAIEMCRMAAADGTTAAIATPHQRHPFWANRDRDLLQTRYEELCQHLPDTFELHLGAEIHLDGGLLDETDLLPGGPLIPMAGSRYLLIECSATPMQRQLRETVHELNISGWKPILAHTERIPWLAADPDLIIDLVQLGALNQLTGSSLFGASGQRARQAAHWMIDNNLAHFMASDGHHPETRPPIMSRAYRAIADNWDEDTADRLMHQNPRRVIEDQPIEP